jgi:hypothetical protein
MVYSSIPRAIEKKPSPRTINSDHREPPADPSLPFITVPNFFSPNRSSR